MKKTLCLSLATLFFTACFSACQSYYSAGTFNDNNVHAIKNDYTLLGNVKGEASYTTIFCCIVVGSGGYIAAYKDALHNCPEADDLIDLKVDNSLFSVPILNLFYMNSAVELYGKAIKYKNPIPKKEFLEKDE